MTQMKKPIDEFFDGAGDGGDEKIRIIACPLDDWVNSSFESPT
jgi:hypothetical protein